MENIILYLHYIDIFIIVNKILPAVSDQMAEHITIKIKGIFLTNP